MEFKKIQLEKAREIDNILRRYLPTPAGGQSACMDDMAYSVLGGGKRLRPMLMRETCALFAEDTSVAEPFMAAIEMIHTYSLIHDDIMDDDDERRGRPTIHAKYRQGYLNGQGGEAEREAGGNTGEAEREAGENAGEAERKAAENAAEAAKFGESMAILAGDALLTYAFEIMAEAAEKEFQAAALLTDERPTEAAAKEFRAAAFSSDEQPAESAEKKMDSQIKPAKLVERSADTYGKHARRAAAGIRAMSLIAKKAGVYGMVGGQVIDVQNVGTDMTAEQVKNINELKTSALIEASMMAGAILGGADDASIKKIERAASMIGQAFQIQDDILDVTGNAADLGKPVGSDDKNDKNTYVRIYGLAECRRLVEELSEGAIGILRSCNFSREPDGFLEELLRSLVNRDH